MRTSNMTEGGPKSSTQKRKKSAHIAALPVPAPGYLPLPLPFPVHVDGSSAGCAAVVAPLSVVHSRNEQIVAITLCLCRLPPFPVAPAPLSGLCRIFPCSTLLSLLSHQRPLVKVAGVACSAMRVDSISNISIHPSACPLANDAPTTYLGAPNCCPLHVHVHGLPL